MSNEIGRFTVSLDPHRRSPPISKTDSRPTSATDLRWSLIALTVALGLVWIIAPWCHGSGGWRSVMPYSPLIPCLGIALVFVMKQVLAALADRHHGGGAETRVLQHLQLQRVGMRLCGVVATLALVAFAYWLLPEYHAAFYDPYWRYLRTLAPVAILIPFYLIWVDRRYPSDVDEYLEVGKLVIHGWRSANRALVVRHALGWLVKAYFLPLMTVYLSQEMTAFYQAIQSPTSRPLYLYWVLYHLGFLIDLLFAVGGYTFALRLFDTHIRSVDSTLGGWVVTLLCYQPFLSMFGRAYTGFDDKPYWQNLLHQWPGIQMGWQMAIITLVFIYCLSTAAFGLRFSNLTNRGIITDGPYRFSKHPAYLAKNLSWWLISVPIYSAMGWRAALRNCCLLGLVNLIYYARARTEERHLSLDPTYVEYALWIDRHGLLAPLSKLLPFIRYKFRASAT